MGALGLPSLLLLPGLSAGTRGGLGLQKRFGHGLTTTGLCSQGLALRKRAPPTESLQAGLRALGLVAKPPMCPTGGKEGHTHCRMV